MDARPITVLLRFSSVSTAGTEPSSSPEWTGARADKVQFWNKEGGGKDPWPSPLLTDTIVAYQIA
jgi:hypothetical protein